VVSISWTSPDSHVWTAGEVLTASNMNTYIRLNLDFLYGDIAWSAPVYTNAWVDYLAGYRAGGYRLAGTQVYLRGIIKSGTIGSSAFTLPLGYRPGQDLQFGTVSNNAFGMLYVGASGAVTPTVGSNAAFSLNAVFDTL
jgi:hypothetical protein